MGTKAQSFVDLADEMTELVDLQKRLFPDGSSSVLVVLQAMDAAAKDSTIRSIVSGLHPAGVDVHPFGVPTEKEGPTTTCSGSITMVQPTARSVCSITVTMKTSLSCVSRASPPRRSGRSAVVGRSRRPQGSAQRLYRSYLAACERWVKSEAAIATSGLNSL